MTAKQSEEYLFHQCCKKTATNTEMDIIANNTLKKFKHNYDNKIFVCIILLTIESHSLR